MGSAALGGVATKRSAVEESLDIELPCELESAGRARHRLEPFRALMDEARFGDLRLLVSTLVTEVVRVLGNRPDESLRLRVDSDERLIRASVEARGGADFVLSTEAKGNFSFSLYLIERLSESRGVQREENGTIAWLEMALDEAR
jgi:hypothetical protein